MTTYVYNLASVSPQPESAFSLEPREAVIAAHAQSLGDFETWNYEEKYGDQVLYGAATVICGNFSTWSNPNETREERFAKVALAAVEVLARLASEDDEQQG